MCFWILREHRREYKMLRDLIWNHFVKRSQGVKLNWPHILFFGRKIVDVWSTWERAPVSKHLVSVFFFWLEFLSWVNFKLPKELFINPKNNFRIAQKPFHSSKTITFKLTQNLWQIFYVFLPICKVKSEFNRGRDELHLMSTLYFDVKWRATFVHVLYFVFYCIFFRWFSLLHRWQLCYLPMKFVWWFRKSSMVTTTSELFIDTIRIYVITGINCLWSNKHSEHAGNIKQFSNDVPRTRAK